MGDIGETQCLRDETRILTIRKLRPEQLEKYVGQIAGAVNAKEPLIKKNEQTEVWTVPPLSRFEPIFEIYRKAFEQQRQSSDELDVLGLPLLTYLTVRLVAEWKGDLSPLLENTTTLYRHLIDLTCKEAGKGGVGGEDGSNQHKIYGEKLRQLLWQTLNSDVFNEFERAEFDYIYIDGERLDRKMALQRLREMLTGKRESGEAR